MMIEPAIVVIAYNRVKPLQRLLNSIANGQYASNNITLHISIDASENLEVRHVAQNFDWKHGEKVIDVKSEKHGLLKHVLECGELTKKYGSIIVLEDDLLVAPGFYQYAKQANKFYSTDANIAGVSLFTYPVEENNFYSFQPIREDSDVHFIQVASSWGQIWNKEQWSKFKSWLIENPKGKEVLLPAYIKEWGNNSWKKIFNSYLIDTDRYFVFPNTSYSTNFEEVGTNSSQTGLFQVQMNLGMVEPKLIEFKEANSVYDTFFELVPSALKRLIPQFSEYDTEVDIYGKKPLGKLKAEYLLTTRKCKDVIKSFGSKMTPLLQNVIFEIEGRDISLIRKSNVIELKELNRFVRISESNINLQRFSNVYTSNKSQVTVVIPVTDAERLEHTIRHLDKDRFHYVTVLICGNINLSEALGSLEEVVGCTVEWIHSEKSKLSDLLHIGFEACTTDFTSWIQAGMEINLKKFERVAKVLSGMKQVNFLRGVDDKIDNSDFATKNSAPWRMTPQLAYAHSNISRNVSSEMMVWRTSIMDEIKSELKKDYSNLFIELLKATPLYVLVDQIGSRNDIKPIHHQSKSELRESLRAPQFKRNFMRRAVAHPYLHPFFYRDIPFIRFFYKEIERFPLVIRYDVENDSYYLSNY